MDTPKPRQQDISDPQRRSQLEYWPVVRHEALPREFYCPVVDFFDLLNARRSRRTFSRLSLQDMSNLLWFSQRHIGVSPSDRNRVKTPIPTAGALSSVQTIVLGPSSSAWLYEPSRHCVGILPASSDVCNQIRREAHEYISIGEGTLLLFAASRPFIEQYYENPDSLVLREAGALLGTLALLSEALEFSFCPLGTTAVEWLSALSGIEKQSIIPAGAAVVGRR